ncbi:MAG: AAA family ATPase, partial [Myxococcales bacterium]|nr:AAA family ATPase [Myxococcales bacterium]
ASSHVLLGGRFEARAEAGRMRLIQELDEAAAPPTVFGRRTPFVARARELGLALGLYREAVEETHARGLLISGEPGAGKSRLRVELLSELASGSNAPTVIHCRGDADTMDAGHATLARALRRLSGCEAVPPGEAQRGAVERLGAVLPTSMRAEVVAFLAELAGISLGGATPASVRSAREDPVLMRERMRAALVSFVQGTARIRPIAFVVEDLHAVDEDSLHLLAALLREVEAPLLLVLIGRPEGHARLPAALLEGVHRLELRPLPMAATRRLIQAMLPEAPSTLVGEIAARGGGHPLFVEELVRAVAGGDGDAELPMTVQAVLQARLDRLPDPARRLLRAASAIGTTFWQGCLQSMLPGLDASAILERLAREEVIVRRSSSRLSGEIEWAFLLPLFQQVIYAMAGPRERTRRHAMIAAWLEANASTELVSIAAHLERAEERSRAARYYEQAALAALASGALEAAIRLSTAALALVPPDRAPIRARGEDSISPGGRLEEGRSEDLSRRADAPGGGEARSQPGTQLGAGLGETRGAMRARLLCLRAEASLELGAHGPALEDALEASSEAEATLPTQIRTSRLAAIAHRLHGGLREALTFFDAALALAAEAGAPAEASTPVRIHRCSVLAEMGRSEEASVQLDALRAQLGERQERAIRFLLLEAEGRIAAAAGQLSAMLGAHERALAEARAFGDSVLQVRALDHVSRSFLRLGDCAVASREAGTGARLAFLTRSVALEGELRITYGLASVRSRGIVFARAQVDTAVALAERRSIERVLARALATRALLSLEDPQAAQVHAREALRLASRTAIAPFARVALGRVLLSCEQPEEAIALLRSQVQGEDGARAWPNPWALSARAILAEASVAIGRPEEAREIAMQGVAELERLASSLESPEQRRRFRSIADHAALLALAQGGVGPR